MARRVDTIGDVGYYRSPDERLLNEGGVLEAKNPHLLTMLAVTLEGLAEKAGVQAHCNTVRITEDIQPREDFTEAQRQELAYYNLQYKRHGLFEEGQENGHAVVMRSSGQPETHAAALGMAVAQVAKVSGLQATVGRSNFGLKGRDAEMVERGLKQLGRALDTLDLPPEQAAKAAESWKMALSHRPESAKTR